MHEILLLPREIIFGATPLYPQKLALTSPTSGGRSIGIGRSRTKVIVETAAMLGGSLSPQHGASSGCGWRNGLQLWRVAANILNKQLRTNDKLSVCCYLVTRM
jgi:hypothetical protein